MSRKQKARDLASVPKIGQALPEGHNPESTFAVVVEYEPEPKGLMPPSSIGTTYDPITDTVSDMQVTDKDGYIIVDETYDPPRKVDGSIGKVFPEPRRFMPRDCTQCLTRRKPGESYVRVYSKHGKIRYCRCSLCGNTWAQEGE